MSVAGPWAVQLKASPNSLQSQSSGLGKDGEFQTQPGGRAAVMGFGGSNVQAFSHRHWWWQDQRANKRNSLRLEMALA